MFFVCGSFAPVLHGSKTFMTTNRCMLARQKPDAGSRKMLAVQFAIGAKSVDKELARPSTIAKSVVHNETKAGRKRVDLLRINQLCRANMNGN